MKFSAAFLHILDQRRAVMKQQAKNAAMTIYKRKIIS